MDNKKYYKVVRNFNNKLWSCMVSFKASVIYKIDEWVKAPEWLAEKGYHLCVFESIVSARNFFLELELFGYSIYECEIKGLKDELPNRKNYGSLGYGKMSPSTILWPEGTVMAEQVKLIAEIELW